MGVCSGTRIHVCCFKHGLNQCRTSIQKATWYPQKNKQNTLLHHLPEPQGRFLPNFYASVHCGPTLNIQGFIKIRSGLGER